ncbi:MAG TPA: type II toxin-antitoxin system VapC family toxin [Egibacteraceae bacterium]|nr:type II toxin-antitoxin system VapC family toxin [Egibacteraceae bacterium]
MTARLLVVDASAMVEILRRTDLGDRVAAATRGAAVAAPAHLDAEVLSAVGRLARAGTVTQAAVERALVRMRRLPVRRYPLAPLLQRAWSLRENIALRDGLYVACAEALGAALLTLDGRLSNASPAPVQHLQ